MLQKMQYQVDTEPTLNQKITIGHPMRSEGALSTRSPFFVLLTKRIWCVKFQIDNGLLRETIFSF